ncbi:MAG: hypothetical protein LBP51_00640 [Deferribacteraceae bacterium]|jgi:16S rRNA (cytidine1402-2'-O)-methyltransferase|nr:hypothetical protein [Deferribacteraceae bacterium]
MPCILVAGAPLSGAFNRELLEKIAKADLLVAEERKSALRLLTAAKRRDIPFILLNEHSTTKDIPAIAELAAKKDFTVFVSDAGTPCIADPDYRFIDACIALGVEMRTLPGASSITAALSVSGFDAARFNFFGFPPKQAAARADFYKELACCPFTAVFLERPYALERTVKELAEHNFFVSISISLGGVDEKNLRGFAKELIGEVKGIKAPFTVVKRG